MMGHRMMGAGACQLVEGRETIPDGLLRPVCSPERVRLCSNDIFGHELSFLKNREGTPRTGDHERGRGNEARGLRHSDRHRRQGNPEEQARRRFPPLSHSRRLQPAARVPRIAA